MKAGRVLVLAVSLAEGALLRSLSNRHLGVEAADFKEKFVVT